MKTTNERQTTDLEREMEEWGSNGELEVECGIEKQNRGEGKRDRDAAGRKRAAAERVGRRGKRSEENSCSLLEQRVCSELRELLRIDGSLSAPPAASHQAEHGCIGHFGRAQVAGP